MQKTKSTTSGGNQAHPTRPRKTFTDLCHALYRPWRKPDFGKRQGKNSEKPKSTLRKKRGQDFGKSEGNTKKNNTDFSKTDLSIYPAQPNPIDLIERYREQIKDNIEYNHLMRQYPYDDLDEIVDLMLEVLCTHEDFIKIEKNKCSWYWQKSAS